jgi:hypothetical protein
LPIALALAVVFSQLLPQTATADVIIPGAMATAEGDTSGVSTGLVGDGEITELYQIAASELSAQGLMAGHAITGVRARLEGGEPQGPAVSMMWDDLTIKLAQATNTLSLLSATFADNMTNPVTVLSGSYTLAANSMPGGATPNAFGAPITFATPYYYQGGDLVFFFTRKPASQGSNRQDFADSFTGAGTLYRSVRVSQHNATSGTLGNGLYVLQLQTVAVPEAGAWLLVGAVVAGSCVVQRFRR